MTLAEIGKRLAQLGEALRHYERTGSREDLALARRLAGLVFEGCARLETPPAAPDLPEGEAHGG